MHVIPYFEAMGVTVDELAPKHIQGYYTEKHEQGLKAGTLTRHRPIIRDSLDYAIQTLGLINANPADRVKLPKITCKRIPQFYTEEQLNKLFKAVEGESIEAPVRISATYGLRRSEVLGLQWNAIDFTRKTVAIFHTAVRNGSDVVYDDTVKKNASYRTMPLTSTMESYLRSLQAHQKAMKKACGKDYNDNDYICKWDDGRPLDPDYVTSRFNRFLKEKKLPHIRFHDLRHSSASLLINKGFTLKEVQEWLGHADIASTDIYSHLLYKSKENMASKVNEALSF
jgi:integrase